MKTPRLLGYRSYRGMGDTILYMPNLELLYPETLALPPLDDEGYPTTSPQAAVEAVENNELSWGAFGLLGLMLVQPEGTGLTRSEMYGEVNTKPTETDGFLDELLSLEMLHLWRINDCAGNA